MKDKYITTLYNKTGSTCVINPFTQSAPLKPKSYVKVTSSLLPGYSAETQHESSVRIFGIRPKIEPGTRFEGT
jgi:hypothetical protein